MKEKKFPKKGDPMHDKLGVQIKPGCIIVYATLLSRSAGLKLGKVLAVNWKPHAWNPKFPNEPRITVQGIEDGWRDEPPALNTTKGTLQFPDRVIVLAPSDIPEKYKTLLDSITVPDA